MRFKKIILGAIVLGGLAISGFTKNEITNTDELPRVNNVEYASEPIVVLELFTSQGCSSCPAADRLLNTVKKEYKENVFALSYHVDYWNYIGWKDPFSKAAYADKQSKYNSKIGYRGNYTPEVIVNGREHFVGSSTAKMYAKINSYSNQKTENSITITNVDKNKNSVAFNYELLGNATNKKLRAVLVLDERTTSVKRGENRNRTLTNSNIVVAEKYLTIKNDDGLAYISIPEIVQQNEKIKLILLVENSDLAITGAAKIDI